MDELAKRLSSLSIIISDGPDGQFTAYTKQEPLFCFVRSDIDELKALVEETLESYVKTFYKVGPVRVEAVEGKAPEANTVPIRELKPTRSWAPKLPNPPAELACA